MNPVCADILKSVLSIPPHLAWASVAIVIFLGMRGPLLKLMATAKTVDVSLPGGAKVAVSVETTQEITQDLLDYLDTLNERQVQILFYFIRIENANRLYVIPNPPESQNKTLAHDRENQFHSDLRSLREGHLVHGLDSDGKPTGQFKPGRFVKLFSWTFKLPSLVMNAKSTHGIEWERIYTLASKKDMDNIFKELDVSANSPQ